MACSASQTKDCSKYFREAAIAEGIFNEPLIVSPQIPTVPCVELRRVDGRAFASVFNLRLTDREIVGDGTIFRLGRPDLQRAASFLAPGALSYFRLRIFLPDRNPFIKPIPVSDWYLRSSYEEFEYVDFRFNEARTLPSHIQQRMEQEWDQKQAPISLVAFLTAIPGRSQLSTLNAASYKMRLLEKPTWEAYVPGGIPDGMMVYHWKKARAQRPKKDWEVTEITDLTTFVRLENRHSRWANHLLFLAFALFVGVVGTFASEWIPFPKPIVQSECTMRQNSNSDVLTGKCVESR